MHKQRYILLITGTLLVAVLMWAVIFAQGLKPRLGLDLQGGLSANLVPHPLPGQTLNTDILNQTVEVIRERVDSLGVAEPSITLQGEIIQVQLPGLVDEGQAKAIIGRTAQMQFRPVLERIPPGAPGALNCETFEPTPVADDKPATLCLRGDEGVPKSQWETVKLGPTAVSGARLKDAQAVTDQHNVLNGWHVSLSFDSEGAKQFEKITSELACNQGPTRQMGIVLDAVVEMASPMHESIKCGIGINDGQASINTNNRQDSLDLALVLRSGALPLQLEFGNFKQISPSLGVTSLHAGLLAGAIGALLVGAYLILLYRGVGVLAFLELVIFGVIVYGAIILFGEYLGFTLTMAGIAGVIVSIGTAADSSIMLRERYRDEVRAGRSLRSASEHAFHHAWRTNLAGSIVSLLSAFVLYFLAIGEVRGFAFTLGLSTLIDLIVFGTFTQGAFALITHNKTLANMRIMGLRAGITTEQLHMNDTADQPASSGGAKPAKGKTSSPEDTPSADEATQIRRARGISTRGIKGKS